VTNRSIETDQLDKQVDRIDRLIAECHLVDRVWFCIERTREDRLPKKNIFPWIFQKVHKNYPSIGWSRIFFGAFVMADCRLPGQMPRRHYKPVIRGAQGGEVPTRKFFYHLEKCVGHSLKILHIVQKIWAPLRKLFAPPGVPSWLRAWGIAICFSIIAWQSWFRRSRHFPFCLCITY